MKKVLALFLAILMVVLFTACGGKNAMMSKEEMLEIATPVTRELLDNAIENKAFLKTFVGNVYRFDAEVFSIEEKYAEIEFYVEDFEGIYMTDSSTLSAHLYLSKEELLSLKAGQRIGIVGKIDNIEETSAILNGYKEKGSALIFKNVYIKNEYYECEGILKGKNSSFEGAWNIQIGESAYLKLIYFADSVDTSGFNEEFDFKGDAIKFKSKILDTRFVDAVIIE